MRILKYLYSAKDRTLQPPRLQCHRGYWIEGLKQNSLASIQKAMQLGYEMSEFDIRITKDKVIILFHDDFIQEKKVSEMTLAEVNSFETVDTFEDVLRWFVPYKDNYHLNIEIKSKFVRDRTAEEIVLSLILKYGVQNSVLISSFNPLTLFYFRKNYPAITRALLLTYNNEHGNNFVIKSQVLNFFAFPHFLHLDEKYWRQKKYKNLLELQIPIILWTCNDLKKVETYFKQGVYGIISDRITPQEIKDLT
jgi:glycerophosphoryl diester phosphodiesterase